MTTWAAICMNPIKMTQTAHVDNLYWNIFPSLSIDSWSRGEKILQVHLIKNKHVCHVDSHPCVIKLFDVFTKHFELSSL